MRLFFTKTTQGGWLLVNLLNCSLSNFSVRLFENLFDNKYDHILFKIKIEFLPTFPVTSSDFSCKNKDKTCLKLRQTDKDTEKHSLFIC